MELGSDVGTCDLKLKEGVEKRGQTVCYLRATSVSELWSGREFVVEGVLRSSLVVVV